MTTKQHLLQIGSLNKRIENKIQEIHLLRAMVNNITVANEGDRVQTSSGKDKLGNLVSQIVDMENEVDAMIDKRSEIVRQIESMKEEDKYDILAKRYILGKELKVIAVESKISIRHIVRIHTSAIEDFEEMYGYNYL